MQTGQIQSHPSLPIHPQMSYIPDRKGYSPTGRQTGDWHSPRQWAQNVNVNGWGQTSLDISKQLDQTAKGWLSCLQAVAAITNLLKEAEKSMIYMDSTIGSGVKSSKWMAIPQKVHSRSGYAFRQPSGYHKNLSHTKSGHPTTQRNRDPEVWLSRNHRHIYYRCPDLTKKMSLS